AVTYSRNPAASSSVRRMDFVTIGMIASPSFLEKYRPADGEIDATRSLGHIHSALAYYWDQQEELDREIARHLALADDVQHRTLPAPALARLRPAAAADARQAL